MKRDVPEEDLVPLNFGLGVNNIDKESDVPDGTARKAVNVDITRTGWPRRRKGYTNRLALSNGNSLYSNGKLSFISSGGSLHRIDINNDEISLTALTPVVDRVAYENVLDTVYLTDGVTFGRVGPDGSYRKAWTPNPTGNPTLSETSLGGLDSGKYLLAITNVSVDGEESGCFESVPITLVNGGSIYLTDIPQSDDAGSIRIYMTSTGGSVYYLQQEIPMGTTEYVVSTFHIGKELRTLFAEPMPAGTVLCYHYGVLYSAIDDYIFYSLALRAGLTRMMDNYFPRVGGEIKLIMPHTTGIFVVADQTWFLRGTSPENMSKKMVYPHSGVKGTGVLVPSSILGIEASEHTPMWFTDTGLVAGTIDGQIIPITEKAIAVDDYETGAAMYREEDGIRSIVTTLQNIKSANALKTADSVSFEVRRNGIPIPP